MALIELTEYSYYFQARCYAEELILITLSLDSHRLKLLKLLNKILTLRLPSDKTCIWQILYFQ
jgi:hypothetical protein